MEKAKKALALKEIDLDPPGEYDVCLRVLTCGVCRTDLHIFEGDLSPPTLPLILGHQIVGKVVQKGAKVENVALGDRVGVPWLGGSCGNCRFCKEGLENLCDFAKFTGFHRHGGYAESCIADSRYVFPLPPDYSDTEVAPLLCAGMVGYRALTLTKGAKKIGFYGFGASAHILAQVIKNQGLELYVFTRTKSAEHEAFAKKLGALWVGGLEEKAPTPLDAAILFAPVGELFPKALQDVRKGGSVISAGIHMSDIPSFPYKLLGEERKMSSVANLTREDGRAFLQLATQFRMQTEVRLYPLEKAGEALSDLRAGKIQGAAVLQISP